MATSDVKVTPGTGKNVATNSFTEDAETKELQRIALNNSSGTEIGTSSTPVEVNLRSSTVGVSTAAKQPALGTAGTASADVITVQGIASGTAQAVSEADGANVTLGAKADAKSTATDTTAITAMQVLKQISASVQAPPSQAVTNAGTFAVQSASSTATGSAVPANAFYTAGTAQTSLPTAATAGNLTGMMTDKFGRQVVLIDGIRDISALQTTTISASTAETTIATAVASTFLDVTSILVSNTSATATRVDFRDTTAGSVLFSLYIPAGDVRGFVVHTPLPQTTVNTNWTAQSSVSVTDLRVLVKFIKNK